MKKRIPIFAVLLIACVMAVSGVAVTEVTGYAAPSGQPEVSAAEAYAVDYDTGTVLYEHNATARRPIASMNKIMTLLLCFEAVDEGKTSLDEMITASENAASMGGSQAFLDAHSAYSVRDLIQSITIASANDACVAMAEHLAGSVEGFVAKMNARAAELGMADTNFVNCTGLPAPNHYSCAKDVAAMTRALLTHPAYYEFSGVWMKDLVHPSGRVTGLTNTNRLIRTYNGCDGGKTGFTNEAGFCISATAKRGDMRLVAVVMGEPDSKTRFADAAKLLNYGFANFEVKHLGSRGEIAGVVELTGAKEDSVNAVYGKDVNVFGSRGSGELTSRIEWEAVGNGVSEGQKLGTLYVARDGQVVEEAELVAEKSVSPKSYGDHIRDIASQF